MANGFHAKDYIYAPTAVRFFTNDSTLKKVYDLGDAFLAGNEMDYNDRRVIKEGATYPNVWLETQPMGGEMYAKRNLEVGLNNILIFMQYQRRDGRFPGMIGRAKDPVNGICAYYDWMQGFYFAQPALKMYYLIGKDRGYLQKLYDSLKAFDGYLWSVRDSDGDGCLETWCCWDTGEDNCTRFLKFGAEDGSWGGETAPYGQGRLPYESMEYMAYSFACRKTLSEVSALLDNGEAEAWSRQAEFVRAKVKEYLWIPEKHACFDRDCDNQIIDCLSHVNLRCMYHGLFTQEMADAFLYYHLFNPEEFWTPTPLPATAVNDSFYLNTPKNNWSGPCQGLIYQRSVDALHNYGHYAEAVQVGRKVVELVRKHGVFYQQWDAFTGEPGAGLDGYGPMIFAFDEYLSYLYGVNLSMDRADWSCDVDDSETVYTQEMFGKEYTLRRKDQNMTAFLDGRELFTASAGLRVRTDLDGNLLAVIGIAPAPVEAVLTVDGVPYRGTVEPNGVYLARDCTFCRTRGARYFRPGTVPEPS